MGVRECSVSRSRRYPERKRRYRLARTPPLRDPFRTSTDTRLPLRTEGSPRLIGLRLPARRILQSFLRVGLCVDESVPISVPRFSIPVWREAGLGLGLCVELVLPMPGAVGSPPTPFVDGVAVSAARDKPLAPIKSTKATAAVRMLRCITLSSERISKRQFAFGEATHRS